MNFVIQHDDIYGHLGQILKEFIPDFNPISSLDDSDELYQVLSEFTTFLQENITNSSVATQCFQFINTVLKEGGYDTEDILVLQVFEPIYADTTLSNKVEDNLSHKAKEIFVKYKPM